MNKIKYLSKAAGGRFKYQRPVPKALLDIFGRKNWDYSLGSDFNDAVMRCVTLRRFHDDAIVEAYRLIEDSSNLSFRSLAAFKEMNDLRTNRITNAAKTQTNAELKESDDTDVELWRNTETVMDQAQDLPRNLEFYRLSTFALTAFGDGTYVQAHQDAGRMKGVDTDVLVYQPTKGIQRQMWDMMKSMLDKRIQELSATSGMVNPNTLSAILDSYAITRAITEKTKHGYVKGITRFTQSFGDIPVQSITKKELRDHRDALSSSGMQATSVRQYMAPLLAMLSYAVEEDLISASPGQGIRMPVDKKTVEDRKSLAFTKDEAKAIIAEADKRWADDSKSRLNPARKRLFRETIRALLHTGARPHELWRMAPEEAGFHDREGWSGRGLDICHSKSGNRLIPCPPQAVPFADIVVAGGLNCLSPSGNRPPTDKEIEDRIKGFSDKQMTPLLNDLGIKKDRISLYSTRGTFVTALQRENVEDGVIRDVIGHKADGMLRHYKSRSKMEKMRTVMEAVSY